MALKTDFNYYNDRYLVILNTGILELAEKVSNYISEYEKAYFITNDEPPDPPTLGPTPEP